MKPQSGCPLSPLIFVFFPSSLFEMYVCSSCSRPSSLSFNQLEQLCFTVDSSQLKSDTITNGIAELLPVLSCCRTGYSHRHPGQIHECGGLQKTRPPLRGTQPRSKRPSQMRWHGVAVGVSALIQLAERGCRIPALPASTNAAAAVASGEVSLVFNLMHPSIRQCCSASGFWGWALPPGGTGGGVWAQSYRESHRPQ